MHAVHRQRAQQGGLRVIGGSMFLGFEMMVLEGVRERGCLFLRGFTNSLIIEQHSQKKKGHTSVEFGIVLQDTRDLEQSPEVPT
jgi:hypothetical protein